MFQYKELVLITHQGIKAPIYCVFRPSLQSRGTRALGVMRRRAAMARTTMVRLHR